MEFYQPITKSRRATWNKGKVVGRKAPLKLKEIWAIRFRLQESERLRGLALFNLAIDSKLRGCDLVRLRVSDVSHGARFRVEQRSSSERPNSRSNSRSPNRHAKVFGRGLRKPRSVLATICFRVVSGSPRTSQHASTRAS